MKKHTFSIIFVALSAVLLFLAACGEGEPVDLASATNEWAPIGAAIGDLREEIARCANQETWTEDCLHIELPPEPPSSITDDNSSDDHENPYSSDDDNPYSSPGEEDSSSSEEPPLEGENCIDDSILANFRCYWDPAEQGAGKKTTLKITNIPEGCLAPTAEKRIYASNSVTRYGIATFNANEEVTLSGVYPHISWPIAGNLTDETRRAQASEWPTKGTFGGGGYKYKPEGGDEYYVFNSDDKRRDAPVKSLLTCGVNACSKDCEPLTILEAGKPIVPNISLTCNWPTIGGSVPAGYKGNLSIGSTLPPCTAGGGKPTNSEELGGCTDPYVEYCSKSNPTDCDVSKVNDSIVVKVVVDCNGIKTRFEDKTLKYRTVPNPTLSGTCSWTANGYAVSGTASASKEIIPAGVTLKDSYGRCKISGTTTTLTDAALPTNAYGYGSTLWPTTGKVGAGDYTVATKVDCGTTTPTTTPTAVSCPVLKVIAGCDVQLKAVSTTAVTVPKGGCLDLDYTGTGSPNTKLFLICTNSGSMGPQSLNCTSEMSYGSQKITREASCDVGIGNNPGNASVSKEIASFSNTPASTHVEESGISFKVTADKKITCIPTAKISITCRNSELYFWNANDKKLDYYANGCSCSGNNWALICNGGTVGTKVSYDGVNSYSGCESGYGIIETGNSLVESDFQCKLKNGNDSNW